MLALLLMAPVVRAWDTPMQLPIEAALREEEARRLVSPDIQLFWGTQTQPETQARKGKDRSLARSRSLFRNKVRACNNALLNALLDLLDTARDRGANALIGLRTHGDGQTTDSPTHFRCDAGLVSAQVDLTGDIAILPAPAGEKP
ncbi:hypothetical protein [Viridibacterium curvum]|uniref:Uncharacterized protein n=1 Tax=Viridibacterium curvum TaxID=1101404 RepID=A0ABP9R075_9RHOO